MNGKEPQKLTQIMQWFSKLLKFLDPRASSGDDTFGAILFILTFLTSNSYAQNLTPQNMTKNPNLTDFQKFVIYQGGTEPAFQNEYWNHKEEGIYVDVLTGEPLFSSTDKFDSGTGWPSFTKPISDHEIVQKKDNSHGMSRIEVKSKSGDAHLGHVFNDGPQDAGGMRYCINSAALKFVAKKDLEKEGYGEYLKLFDQ